MTSKVSFHPDRDIGPLTGKVIFITGGTAGLGKQTILLLAKHKPKHIVFTGRNSENAKSVISAASSVESSVKLTFLECDQTSLESVRIATEKFLAQKPERLDIFIGNAGIMGGPSGVSKDGYEIQFAINYLSHALFIRLLLPLLERTASQFGDARIVLLTSVGFRMTPPGGVVFKDLKTPQTNLPIGLMAAKWYRYGQSKLAVVLLVAELAKRYPTLTVAAIHPGRVNTGLIEDLPLLDRWFVKMASIQEARPLEEGAWNTCWGATSTDRVHLVSGGVYGPIGEELKGTKDSSDVKLREKLWDWTDQELGSF